MIHGNSAGLPERNKNLARRIGVAVNARCLTPSTIRLLSPKQFRGNARAKLRWRLGPQQSEQAKSAILGVLRLIRQKPPASAGKSPGALVREVLRQLEREHLAAIAVELNWLYVWGGRASLAAHDPSEF